MSANEKVISEVADATGRLAVELADIAGGIDDLSRNLKAQASLSADLSRNGSAMAKDNSRISQAASEADAMSAQAHQDAHHHQSTIQNSLQNISALTQDVAALRQELDALRRALDDVQGVSKLISTIASKTDLLALNASIQASHAGAAGRAFAVVAAEVKALARQAGDATADIGKRIGQLVNVSEKALDQADQAASRADQAGRDTQTIRSVFGNMNDALGQVAARVGEIAQAAKANDERSGHVDMAIRQLLDGFEAASSGISSARERTFRVLDIGESLIGISASSGVETIDTKFVHLVTNAAKQIGDVFSNAIARGEASLDDFLDRNYQQINGTDPVQFMTRFVGLTDRLLPAIQEPIVAQDDRIVFCAAVDENGFLPTHNLKFSKPQGADPSWNAANSRNRRLFNDRVGLAAGRSVKPFLIQTYRRDMGNGNFVLMKDVSAPIYINGTHWGGLRIAYRI
jgi:methyl-accepting chemotaxis protein